MSLICPSITPQESQAVATFRRLAETVSQAWEGSGVTVRPYRNASLPFFSRLDSTNQFHLIDCLSAFTEVCLECIAEGHSLQDNLVLTWKMMKRMGLTPTEDLFAHITDQHIVEIYSQKNIQIFRNLRFFEICSYSLEELYSRQWWELFRRDDKITQQLFWHVSRIMNGEVKATLAPSVERHWLSEIDSPMKFSMEVDVDVLSPLFEDGKIQAMVAVERAKLSNPVDDPNAISDALERYYKAQDYQG